ncbi:ribonuclease P protein subunit p25 [Patagioenas fasciata]|uniref:Ribonuclease P protein subunit p25 n=1 Tax=Patagioenas fasciata monilis TaxID=372326 RepID=A0A1V4JD12_PATFA|nr:ribonuclease P protein subunit p25 [Patagioenas fasciata monilis]
MAAEGGGAKPVARSRMENFRKVRTSEEESPLPFPDLPPDVVEMKVKEGSKIRNLMNFAMAQMELKGRRQIVFSGSGRAVTKTITCVEIMKRKLGGLHQVTKVRYKTLWEVWENQDPPPGDTAQSMTVHKNVPSICILLSRDPLDPNQTGYQPPEPQNGLGTQPGDAEDTSSSSAKGLKRPLPPPREEMLTKKSQVQAPNSPRGSGTPDHQPEHHY